ncbi:4-phosphoerythronate dehydrogenase [Oceanisphaera arctica]|uniref:Erythronate-4-phosphate dehydrogenase n=1 Tax=Oceanisphaera arctica TaxID=641510 RepID=A0A2P5TPT8_9GAMM|nr:4-phosphoerythronate dehydrogenase [Oceanisphaera arctica]PPL17698.1 4-phosphoerythronate dehydrogenase [Oceanisphaera arctica]GHA18622.1 erythronate-4-phosphate dehydrogenase [Oceanisphaera arctica]
MKLLADENMPFVQELFGDWAEIVTCPGREISPEQLRDVDVLLVRSITRVDETLLAEAERLSFVGTATIGCDHIDTELLARRGIVFASAPGCNKVAVGDYVLAALLRVAAHKGWSLKDKTLGVVGVGNTGAEVAERARALGMTVLLCDPPRALTDTTEFVDFEQALSADIVSFHVPLIRGGEHPTWHLLDQAAIAGLNTEQVLINACRGDVWDNQALLARQQGASPLTLVMDVWEHEPEVLAPLVPHALLATPHIAGYSLEGKARGTFALYRALCEQRQVSIHLTPEQLLPPSPIGAVHLKEAPDQALVARLVRLVYDIEQDDAAFRLALGQPGFFDHLRKQYPQRRELGSVQLSGMTGSGEALGFKV